MNKNWLMNSCRAPSLEVVLCDTSTEHHDGWEAVSILIDPGASDSVALKAIFPDIQICTTNASRADLVYTAAWEIRTRMKVCIDQSYI